tara:strand:- start:679 stop:1659 length:981 start_codon:yes stop_codon:yes gene_type:complete
MEFNFLIASERSGSNLITKLIGAHSTYCAPSPPHLIRAFYDKVDAYNKLNIDDNWGALVEDFLEMFNAKIATWNTTIDFEELYHIKDKSFVGLIHYSYKKEATIEHKNSIFIKEVKTYKLFDFLQKHFPNAKFVYLVRDPRDMALSWKNSPVHRGDLVRAAKIWQEDQSQSIALLEKYPEKLFLIRYEDLVSNQEEELKKVCSFLGIAFEKSMLDFHKSKLSVENAKQTDNWKNLNKGILSNNLKKYLGKLTENEIAYIEYVGAKEMNYLNYKLETPILEDKIFQEIETEILSKERFDKPEYNLVADEEKIKRNLCMKTFNKIKSL